MENLKLGHIALRTPDLEASVNFYRLLGASLTQRDRLDKPAGTVHLAMMRLGNFDLELIQPETGHVDGNLPAQNWAHLAIETADVDALKQALEQAGVNSFLTPACQDMPLYGGIRNINLTGPSGELLELVQVKGA